MGITKWLARKGAVGGTARWAGNGYRFFRQRHPDPNQVSDNDIFRLMVRTRYPDDPETLETMLDMAGTTKGLLGLVTLVLSVEAGFTENEWPVQRMFMDVIEEELEKQGFSYELIWHPAARRGGAQVAITEGRDHVFDEKGLCVGCGWSRDAVTRHGQDRCEPG